MFRNILKSTFRKSIQHTIYCSKSSSSNVETVVKEINILKFESKVPNHFVQVDIPEITPTKIDEETISLLEKLSLIDCANKQGIKTLEDAIVFADRILHINTDNVEPMYTVLEDRHLTLREDEVTDGNIQKDILKNAVETEEDYFVAPPGNIPLQPRENPLYDEKTL